MNINKSEHFYVKNSLSSEDLKMLGLYSGSYNIPKEIECKYSFYISQ